MYWQVILLCCISLIAASSGWAGNGPRISFDRETHDYGKVAYGSTVKEHFSLTNNGDQTLVIKKIRADCGCTKAIKGSAEVPPGGKTEIVTEFDTTDLSPGRKRKHVYVRTNDPTRPEVTLTVYADVVRELVVEPPSFAKKVERPAGPLSFEFKITNHSDKARAITGLHVQETGVNGMLQPARVAIGPNSIATFSVVLLLPEEAHRLVHAGKVFLDTDHPLEKKIDLRYLIQIERPK
ncbi:MAG: DUF1573 domain-containing protein [Thermodesulfobacteriota bacterium]